jgi:hypothetical protein
MKHNLKTINAIFDLIKEDDLANEFNRFKLTHKLSLIRDLSGGDSSTEMTIDYIMENMLSAKKIELVGEINLLIYYSLSEIKEINNALGLPTENIKLTEQLLDSIYSNNERSPKLKEVYHELKWKHFKRPEHYDHVNYQGLTNVADRIQYQKEQANESR